MRFLVTRPQPDCLATANRLRALGQEAVELPLLVFRPGLQSSPDLAGVRALAVTSRRAVDALTQLPGDPALLETLRELPVFAVGDKTADACGKLGFKSVFSAGSDVHGLGDLILSSREKFGGGAVLYLAAEERSGDLCRHLQDGGVACRTVPVYRMDPVKELPERIAASLSDGAFDGVLVFSRRTGEVFQDLLRAHKLGHLFSNLPVYVISMQAAEGLEGFEIVHVAEAPREDALIDLVLAEC